MKEIITPGNAGITIKYYNTCPYCGCYYTYQQEDLYNDGLTTVAGSVTCPCCGMKNTTLGSWGGIGGRHNPYWPPLYNPISYYNNDKQNNSPKEQEDGE